MVAFEALFQQFVQLLSYQVLVKCQPGHRVQNAIGDLVRSMEPQVLPRQRHQNARQHHKSKQKFKTSLGAYHVREDRFVHDDGHPAMSAGEPITFSTGPPQRLDSLGEEERSRILECLLLDAYEVQIECDKGQVDHGIHFAVEANHDNGEDDPGVAQLGDDVVDGPDEG